MLRASIFFLAIALIAGVFGFFIIATGAAFFAKILFYIFIFLFLVSVVFGKKAA